MRMVRDFEYSRIFPGDQCYPGGTLAVPVSQPTSIPPPLPPSKSNVGLLRRQTLRRLRVGF